MEPSASALPPSPAARAWVRIALALWITAAVAFAAAGGPAHLPRPAVPLLIWGPVFACALLYRRGGALRDFVDRTDVRVFVLFHVVRVAFGAAFLVEAAAGRIPDAFARVAGPGDIAAGLLALPAAWLAPRADRASRALLLGWNALALADILLVFATAQRLMFVVGDVTLLRAFGRFPYGVLPVLVVPWVVLTHLAIFARTRRARAR